MSYVGDCSPVRSYYLPSRRLPMGKAKTESKPRVLIVEDSPDFSNLLKFIVEDEGVEGIQFPVTEADILSWVRSHKPILIITDLALRKKSGLEYIKDLKENHDTKKIPVVIITGRDLTHKEILELEMQGVKYFRKGRVDMADIRNEVRRCLPST
jgi:two-component system alkaline phosphatase synthesis response regulator PhoP